MRKARALAGVFLAMGVSWAWGTAYLEGPLPTEDSPKGNPFHDYVGVLHIHTRYSDGSGTFEELAQAAVVSGVDFLITADHNTLQPLFDHREGWYGRACPARVLMLCGEEISSRDGHLFVIGVQRPVTGEPATWGDSLRPARPGPPGALSFIAHPYHPRIRWRNWNFTRVDGMEILNADEQWRDETPLSLLGALVSYPLSLGSLNSLTDRPDNALAKWDELSQARRVIGLGSSDAHARIRLSEKWSLAFPSYARLFRTIRTHIVTRQPLRGRFEEDKRVILEALRQGHAYFANDGYSEAKGFEFFAVVHADTLLMGDSTRVAGKKVIFQVRRPPGPEAEIRLLKDGKSIAESASERLHLEATEPGVYRVEVYQGRRHLPFFTKRLRPWIFSNPIYWRALAGQAHSH